MSFHPESPISANSPPLVPDDFLVEKWEDLLPVYQQLLEARLDSLVSAERWLLQVNHWQAILSEAESWHYIQIAENQEDRSAREAHQYFHQSLKPQITQYDRKLYTKLLATPFLKESDLQGMPLLLTFVKRSTQLFEGLEEKDNAKLEVLLGRHSQLASTVHITFQEQEMDLSGIMAYLQSGTPKERKAIWKLVQERRGQDSHSLQALFVHLCTIRQALAGKAGCDNYVSYAFQELGRIDYTPDTCFAFHETVAQYITPVYEGMMAKRAKALGVERIRPWDLQALTSDHVQLQPFESISDLLEKTQSLFDHLDPAIGAFFQKIQQSGHLHLTPIPYKSPGAFSLPMWRSGNPMIAMSAQGTEQDLISFMHECGHALQFHLMQDLPLPALVPLPRELAELAAMTMELLVMEHYGLFYETPLHLAQARQNHLYRVLSVLPMVATLDAFQHWIYSSPAHRAEDRNAKWRELYLRFHGEAVDWTGFEDELGRQWLLYAHLFETPFYSIEYGFATGRGLDDLGKISAGPPKSIDPIPPSTQDGLYRLRARNL